MKRIVFSLSMLLMLAQNGFARSDSELDKMIANESDKTWKQIYRCEKASNSNNNSSADIGICLKAINLINQNPYAVKDVGLLNALAVEFVNTGVLYYYSEKNYLKAYEYYMKAARLGNTKVQKNLDILCRKHSWVCK